MKLFLFLVLGFNFLYGADFPNRIISLGPTITEQLYLLNAEDRIIANTVYCLKPEDAKYKEKIGTITEQNIEKIVSLQPDIILATSLTNPKTIAKLRNLNLKVVQFPYAKSFDEICNQLLTLGKIVDKQDLAEKIVLHSKKEVEKIKNKTKKISKPKIFVQIGTNPLFTATKESFINEFILFAGGINIASNAKSEMYSREKVVKQNPDIIIIISMGIASEEEKKIWQKFKTISAVKNNKIYIVDAYKICSPTPVSFVETLNEMCDFVAR